MNKKRIQSLVNGLEDFVSDLCQEVEDNNPDFDYETEDIGDYDERINAINEAIEILNDTL